MVCVCVVTTFSMFDDPPCKKRIMSQLFGHHNLNAIVCTYYVVLDRVDSLTKRFLFVPINDKIDSINGLAVNILFAKTGILTRLKTYILHLHTHHTSCSTEHIPAKIGFAETIGFMQGRKPLIVSKGRTTDYGTGLVWWPAYYYRNGQPWCNHHWYMATRWRALPFFVPSHAERLLRDAFNWE